MYKLLLQTGDKPISPRGNAQLGKLSVQKEASCNYIQLVKG